MEANGFNFGGPKREKERKSLAQLFSFFGVEALYMYDTDDTRGIINASFLLWQEEEHGFTCDSDDEDDGIIKTIACDEDSVMMQS